MNNASLFLGFRYLRPKRTFVSVITFISVLGVMLGVGVLVVVMAVFKGWQVEFRSLLLGFEPHVVLIQDARPPEEAPDPPPRSHWSEVMTMVRAQPGVVSATPMVEGVAAIRFENSDPEPVEMMGLPEDHDNAMVKKLKRHLKDGAFDLSGDNIVITDKLAERLKVKVGDVLSVLARDTIEQMMRDMRAAETETDPEKAAAVRDEITVLPRDLTIVALLSEDTAGGRCYASLNIAQELFKLESDVSGIEVELAEPDFANEIARGWFEAGLMPPDWNGRTWITMHGDKLRDVESQKSMMYFILVFVMLVASTSVMNTTITVTVQKRKEIGILNSLGSRSSQIIGIFLVQAGVVAAAGIVLGILGGLAVLHVRNDLRALVAEVWDIDFFPQEIYFLSEIPAYVQGSDVASICGLAVVLCLLASLLPAWMAARVDPAVALRG